MPFDGASGGEIGVTLFADKLAREQSFCIFTPAELEELALLIRLERAATKDRLPLLKLAAFGGYPTDKDCLRYDANVVAIYGAEADYDGPRHEDDDWISLAEAVAILKTANIRALVYETATATPERPKWRVLAFASRPYTGCPDELRVVRAAWVARMNGLLRGQLDPISFNLSHAHYYGGIEEKGAPRVVLISGDPIDLRGDLDAIARWKRGGNKPASRHECGAVEIPEGLEESDDDPRLLGEGARRVEINIARQGVGTQPQGARIFALVQWLGDMRTAGGLILSAEAIHALIEEACPETTLRHVVNMLSRRHKARGCEPIDAPPTGEEDKPDPSRGTEEALTAEISPEAATEVMRRLFSEWHFRGRDHEPTVDVVRSPAGLGKTWNMTEVQIGAYWGCEVRNGRAPDFLDWRLD